MVEEKRSVKFGLKVPLKEKVSQLRRNKYFQKFKPLKPYRQVFINAPTKFPLWWLLLLFPLAVLVLFFFFLFNLDACGDGTSYDECSGNMPYYCLGGVLTEMASYCGCPEGFVRDIDSCLSDYNTNPKVMTFYYSLDRKKDAINFTAYEGFYNYTSRLSRGISMEEGVPSRRDFKLKVINDKLQREMLMPLVIEIQNQAGKKKEQAEIAINLIQNIPYDFSESNLSILAKALNSRYPYDVLYENLGICGERSELLAFLLKEIGYGVAILYYPIENHEAVGIKCSSDESGYCYIETTTSLNVELFNEPEIIVIADGESF